MERLTFEEVMRFVCKYLGQNESAWLRVDQDLRFTISRAMARCQAGGVEFCKRDAVHLVEAWEIAHSFGPLARPVFVGM